MSSVLRITTDSGDLELQDGAERDFYINRQIFDLNNFETRKSDYTKQLTVPATPRNNSILRISSSIATDVVAGAQKIQCSITLNGITVAPIAWLIVSAIKETKSVISYEVVIFYGNFSVFEELKEGDLSDINFTDLDIDWTIANLIPKTSNTYLDNDIVFPVSDWYDRESRNIGYLQIEGINTQDINTNGFFLYCRNIIERMLAQAGFSLIVDETVPEEFNLIALACPVPKFIEPFIYEGTAPLAAWTKSDVDQLVDSAGDLLAEFSVVSDPSGAWDAIAFAFVIKDTQDYIIDVNGFYDHVRSHPNQTDSWIGIYVNNVLIDSITTDITESNIPFRVRITTNLIVSDVVQVKLHAGDFNGNYAELTMKSSAAFSITTPGNLTDRVVIVSEYVPQMSQGSFLANLLKLYNLFLVTDDINKTVTLSSFDILAENEDKDLSTRLSVEQDIEIKLSVNSLGKNSIFEWQKDDLLRRDTDITLTFDNNLLTREKIVVGMDFSACDNSTLFFRNNIDTIPKAKIPMVNNEKNIISSGSNTVTIFVRESDGVFSLGDGYELDFEVGDYFQLLSSVYHTHRVIEKSDNNSGVLQFPLVDVPTQTLVAHHKMSANTFSDRLAIVYQDGGEEFYNLMNGNTFDITPIPVGGLTAVWPDNLKMSSVVDNQYKRLLNALRTPQFITAQFALSSHEVLNFDFRKPVYVEEFNAYYYVNKISQYKIDTLTRLELVRVSNLLV